MASAFQQYTATHEKACMTATIQDVHGVECVVFSTTGVFGDILAGDSYNLIGQVVDHRRNRLLPHITNVDGPISYSVCYMDDGIVALPNTFLCFQLTTELRTIQHVLVRSIRHLFRVPVLHTPSTGTRL